MNSHKLQCHLFSTTEREYTGVICQGQFVVISTNNSKVCLTLISHPCLKYSYHVLSTIVTAITIRDKCQRVSRTYLGSWWVECLKIYFVYVIFKNIQLWCIPKLRYTQWHSKVLILVAIKKAQFLVFTLKFCGNSAELAV